MIAIKKIFRRLAYYLRKIWSTNPPLESIKHISLLDKVMNDFPTKIVEGAPIHIDILPTSIPEIEVSDEVGKVYVFRFLKSRNITSQYFLYISLKHSSTQAIYQTSIYNINEDEQARIIYEELKKNNNNMKKFILYLRDTLKKNYISPQENHIRPNILFSQSSEIGSTLELDGDIAGTAFITESQYASPLLDVAFESDQYSHAIGWLSYISDDNSQSHFLCTAFLVHQEGIIITARHALNDLLISQLRFNLSNVLSFSICGIIESSENFLNTFIDNRHQIVLPDYALFKINNPDNIPLPISLSLSGEDILHNDVYNIIGYGKEKTISAQNINIANPVGQQSLVLNYFANTISGFSGSPIINIANKKVIGIHCKTSIQPISISERTGLSMAHHKHYYPNSILSQIIRNETLSYPVLPSLQPLANVTSLIDGFSEREEGGLREAGLGKTPSLGNSHTYRCILARWLLKGEEKIQFSADPDDPLTKITYRPKPKSYKIERKSYSMIITEKDLQNQANGLSIYPKDNDLGAAELINRFFSPWYWKVKVKKDKNEYAERKWVELSEKFHDTQPVINMGHKLSANEYWIKGAMKYLYSRLEEKKMSSKYMGENRKFNQKVMEYEKRYLKYSVPGHMSYAMLINEDFMRDPKNYRFEWHERNKSDGAKNKVGNYKDACPPGLDAEDNRCFVPTM